MSQTLYDLHAEPFVLQNPTLDYASTIQVVAAASDQLAPSGGLLRVSADAPITLSGVQAILWPNAVVGQLLTIINVGTQNVILSKGTTEKLALGAATRTLGAGGSISLIYTGTVWIELNFLTAAGT